MFLNIPYDTEYEVTESEESSRKYTVTKTNDTGRIDDADIDVSFVNTLDVGVPTSADTRTQGTGWMLVVFAAAAGILLLWMKRRRYDD